MHHLVMGKHQNKILMKCVQQRKGNHVVMVLSMDRILGSIGQEIVHPTHIPF